MKNHFEIFPDELIVQILGYLDLISLYDFSLVDKRSYNLANEFLKIAKTINLREISPMFDIKEIIRIRKSGGKNILENFQWKKYSRIFINCHPLELQRNFFYAIKNNHHQFIEEFYKYEMKLDDNKKYSAAILACFQINSLHVFKLIHLNNGIDLNYIFRGKILFSSISGPVQDYLKIYNPDILFGRILPCAIIFKHNAENFIETGKYTEISE